MSILLEQEIKFRLSSWEEGETRLVERGAALVKPRRFEVNRLFDFGDGRLDKRGSALRLRTVLDEAWLTFKGPQHGSGRIKQRRELESFLGDGEAIGALLTELGLEERFRYEKYRADYELGATQVSLDATPIGIFLEIEGEPGHILQAAEELGLDAGEALTSSYPRLYELYRQEVPDAPEQMVFPREVSAT